MELYNAVDTDWLFCSGCLLILTVSSVNFWVYSWGNWLFCLAQGLPWFWKAKTAWLVSWRILQITSPIWISTCSFGVHDSIIAAFASNSPALQGPLLDEHQNNALHNLLLFWVLRPVCVEVSQGQVLLSVLLPKWSKPLHFTASICRTGSTLVFV